MSRYNRRPLATNKEDIYDKLFEKRGVEKIIQYRSPSANYVTDEELEQVECYDYTWKFGDSYEKLASRYYGNPSMWYVIASFNRKPTENHVSLGDTIKIPVSLADALQVVG